MSHGPELHASVTVPVGVNEVTVPTLSVLLPEGGVGRGDGLGRGRGVGVGLTAAVVVVLVLEVQFTRSAALARMQINAFVFIG